MDVEAFEPGTITISTRATDNGAWHEIGRHPNYDDGIEVVCSASFAARAADYGIEPGTVVRVAVLDEAGNMVDSYTMRAE